MQVEWYRAHFAIAIVEGKASRWNLLVLLVQMMQFACSTMVFAGHFVDDFAMYVQKESERLAQKSSEQVNVVPDLARSDVCTWGL